MYTDAVVLVVANGTAFSWWEILLAIFHGLLGLLLGWLAGWLVVEKDSLLFGGVHLTTMTVTDQHMVMILGQFSWLGFIVIQCPLSINGALHLV